MNMSLLLRVHHLRILVLIGATIALMVAAVPALAQSGEKPRAPELYTPSTTHDSVVLRWWETADPAALGITYEVQRRNGGGWNVVNGAYGQMRSYSDGSVTIPFTDSSVSPDTNYTYRVYAIKGDRRSDSSRRVLAITEPAPERYVAPVSTPEPTAEPTAEPTPAPTAEPTPENQDVGTTPQQQVPVDDPPQQQVPVDDPPQQHPPQQSRSMTRRSSKSRSMTRRSSRFRTLTSRNSRSRTMTSNRTTTTKLTRSSRLIARSTR